MVQNCGTDICTKMEIDSVCVVIGQQHTKTVIDPAMCTTFCENSLTDDGEKENGTA